MSDREQKFREIRLRLRKARRRPAGPAEIAMLTQRVDVSDLLRDVRKDVERANRRCEAARWALRV